MPIDNPEPRSQDGYSNRGLGPRSHLVLIICMFLLVLGANEWIYFNAQKYFQDGARSAEYAAAAISFVVLLITFFFRPLVAAIKAGRHSVMIVGSIESFRHMNSIDVVLMCTFGVSIAVIALSQADWKTKFLGLLFIYVVPGVILQSRQLPINLAFKGSYDKALRVQRWIQFLPDCGDILRGWIYLEAGRYQEARDVLAPGAFDATLKPRPHRFHLVLYGHALSSEGRVEEAITIFEVGTQASTGFGNYEMELSSCLLVKGVDAVRARELMERVISGYVFERAVDSATAIGLHAYSLAANGEVQHAKDRLQEALNGFDRFKARDRAAMWIIVGATYRAMNQLEPARNAFEEAIRTHPFGDVRLRAEDWLKTLDQKPGESATT
jgi:tetratricopeptide (TPR) repeat protein